MKLKIGDLVTHNALHKPRYCIVVEIGSKNDKLVWGNWQDTIEEARNCEKKCVSHIDMSEAYLVETKPITNWRDEFK